MFSDVPLARYLRKIFFDRKRLLLLLTSFLCFLAAFVIFISILPVKISIPLVDQSRNQVSNYSNSDYWKKEIDDIGPEKAYELLKKGIAGLTYSRSHQTLHIFGVALYEKFGLDGIKYCDDYQSYGCFHGFMASYISDKGLSALNETAKVCPGTYPLIENRCFHGIGHGLVDSLGKHHLNEAFSYCQKIGSMTYRGCPQGVVMEYFIPINQQSQEEYERFDEKKLFGPCPEVNSQFQKYCYAFVPMFYWPVEVIDEPTKTEYYCQTLAQPLQQQMCLVSVGIKLAVRHNFNLELAWDNCAKMTSLKSQVYCSVGVQWNGGVRKQDLGNAEKFCSKLGEGAKSCLDVVNDLYSRKPETLQ